jgi:hypothetical protein
MKLHETEPVDTNTERMKVPGGWIYITSDNITTTAYSCGQWNIISTVFVPEPKEPFNTGPG